MPTVFYTRWLSCDSAQFLGQGCLLILSFASFITFCVRTALQQKQRQQCIIYCLRCRSLLSENNGQISIWDSNTKCMQIKFEFEF